MQDARSRVLFCGELIADFVERDKTTFTFSNGGPAINSAFGAARLLERQPANDITVGFVGWLSSDQFGERVCAELAANGVDVSSVTRSDNPTALAVVFNRNSKENEFRFYELASISSTLPDVAPAGTRHPTICCFGSLSSVMAPACDHWLRYAASERDNGSVVCFDVNARPVVARSPNDYQHTVARWADVSQIIKCSDFDIEWTYPGMTFDEVAQAWFRRGVKLAVCTLGARGAVAIGLNGTASAASKPVNVTNTVGAGDNFVAGLALSITRQKLLSHDALANLTASQLRLAIGDANDAAEYFLRHRL